MKKLWIVRHAKAENPENGQADFDRRLTDRGKANAIAVAEKTASQGVHPDWLVSSPARRARSTAKRFAKAFGMNKEDIVSEPAIYEARLETLLQVIRSIPETKKKVIIFGHNPGFSMLCNFLCNTFNEELPTCGTVLLELDAHNWEDVSRNCGKVVYYNIPE